MMSDYHLKRFTPCHKTDTRGLIRLYQFKAAAPSAGQNEALYARHSFALHVGLTAHRKDPWPITSGLSTVCALSSCTLHVHKKHLSTCSQYCGLTVSSQYSKYISLTLKKKRQAKKRRMQYRASLWFPWISTKRHESTLFGGRKQRQRFKWPTLLSNATLEGTRVTHKNSACIKFAGTTIKRFAARLWFCFVFVPFN